LQKYYLLLLHIATSHVSGTMMIYLDCQLNTLKRLNVLSVISMSDIVFSLTDCIVLIYSALQLFLYLLFTYKGNKGVAWRKR